MPPLAQDASLRVEDKLVEGYLARSTLSVALKAELERRLRDRVAARHQAAREDIRELLVQSPSDPSNTLVDPWVGAPQSADAETVRASDVPCPAVQDGVVEETSVASPGTAIIPAPESQSQDSEIIQSGLLLGAAVRSDLPAVYPVAAVCAVQPGIGAKISSGGKFTALGKRVAVRRDPGASAKTRLRTRGPGRAPS
mmetsp:Transcript_11694/g.29384  ORF Transcript_11694/g.29384 Transcript_11694/m.29384 type:complete len:197 (-) Transcript_11694:179-769(-)